MTAFVWANFFQTTLSAAVTSTQTTIQVASASGVPTIAAGQQWTIVVQSASTPSVREVMYATAITSTTVTVARAQEGTAAGTWAIGDNVFGGNTAGQMGAFFQTATALGGALSGTLPNPAIANQIILAAGQCVLQYTSATELTLLPHNGCNVLIAGQQYQIPSAGLTVSNSGLAASTLYYVYLLNSSGTLGLQCSTTGHVTDTTAGNVGVEIMSGNNAHSLVGMAYTNSSGQFVSGLVRSWFNRGPYGGGVPAVTNSTANTTFVSIGPSAQILAWDGEVITATASGYAYNDTALYGAGMVLGVNGSTGDASLSYMTSAAANNTGSVVSAYGAAPSSDGITTLDCYGQTGNGFSASGNATFDLAISWRVG